MGGRGLPCRGQVAPQRALGTVWRNRGALSNRPEVRRIYRLVAVVAGKSLLTDALSIQTAPLWIAGQTTGVAQFHCVSSRTTWIIDPCVASGALTAVPIGIAPRSLQTTAVRSALVYGIVFGAVTTGP